MQKVAAQSGSQCVAPVYLKSQMSLDSEDTYVASLRYECKCESSKILWWQNSCHNVYSGTDVPL